VGYNFDINDNSGSELLNPSMESDHILNIYSLFNQLSAADRGDLWDCSESFELEYRIKSVDELAFMKLFDHLSTYHRGIRITYAEKRVKVPMEKGKCIHRQIRQGRSKKIESKSQITKHVLYEHWTNLVLSSETEITFSDYLTGSVAKEVPKERWRFDVGDGKGYADMTVIGDKEKFSVEIELLRTDWDALSFLDRCLMVLQDSTFVVKRSMYACCLDIASTKFDMGSGSPFCINDRKFQTPVTMVARDYGLDLFNGEYFVTPKMDGERRFLILVNGKCYSVDQLKRVRLEKNGHQDYDDGRCCILDCESVDECFYIIDVVVYRGIFVGDDDISPTARIARFLTDHQFDNSFLRSKEYVRMDAGPDDVKNLAMRWRASQIAIDGVVIVSRKYSGKCLKVKYETSVDLRSLENGSLESSDGVDFSEHVIGEAIFKDHEVYEFGIDREGNLVPRRPRPDKPSPNSSGVVRRNMSPDVLIMSVFDGRGALLMRKYHNILKRIVLKNMVGIRGSTLLDVGSGQGGDMMKWTDAKTVYCLEPSETARAEFVRRSKSLKKICDIRLLPYRTSESDKLLRNVTRGVGIITLFFCLNLFEGPDFDGLFEVIRKRASNNCRVVGIYMEAISTDISNECFEIKHRDGHTYALSIMGGRINQVENTFDFGKFAGTMGSLGYRLSVHSKLGYGFKTMSSNERLLNSMFRLFEFRNKKGVIQWWGPNDIGRPHMAIRDIPRAAGRVVLDKNGSVVRIDQPGLGHDDEYYVMSGSNSISPLNRSLTVGEINMAHLRILDRSALG